MKSYITFKEIPTTTKTKLFHVISKTDEEIKEVLKDEVNTYRELHRKLTKGVVK